MKKYISILLTAACLSLSTVTFTSCAGTGVGTVVTSAQAWLNDPKNQALIQEIAAAANILIGAFAEKRGATTTTTVTGKLATQYPDVPAGAISTIAHNPKAYLKQ